MRTRLPGNFPLFLIISFTTACGVERVTVQPKAVSHVHVTGVAAGTARSGAARDPSNVREISRLRDDLGQGWLPHVGANDETPGHSRARLPGGGESDKVSPAGVTIELEFG
jgi:hypothetical protein